VIDTAHITEGLKPAQQARPAELASPNLDNKGSYRVKKAQASAK